MAKTSAEYWQERAEKLENEIDGNSTKVYRELKKEYEAAKADIDDQLRSFYSKYATDNVLTLQEAELALHGADLNRYRERIASYRRMFQQTGNLVALAEIEKLTTTARVTRLKALSDELAARTIELTSQVDATIADHLGETLTEAYLQTAFTVQAGVGAFITVQAINKDAIKQVITYPWSGDDYSSRIWVNREKMVRDMTGILKQGLIQGTSIQTMSRQLNEKTDAGARNTERIIRTEANFVLNEGAARGYEANGMERYRVLATLDTKTSSVCQSQDGSVYKVSERVVGKTYPPYHPNCRTTVIPHIPDIEGLARRARDPETGRNYIVEDMTYKEWKETLVRNGS
jgi:SPP1 gp7 family putative phage head morphogenesis protein